ncbi:phosphotransferase [Kribbella sp. NPDC023855]|uniref:phosphotransferase n=1 Tax=Kribbella sp. NPDC023855 TaxID=3154698 RepID=UPI003403BADA
MPRTATWFSRRSAAQTWSTPSGTANWLLAAFDHLQTLIPQDQSQVLLHGDVALQNLMAHDNQLQGLIDLGDAAWGPPGMEFAKLRLEQVVAMLADYRGGEGLEASILWFHLGWGLGNLTQGPATRAAALDCSAGQSATRRTAVLRVVTASTVGWVDQEAPALRLTTRGKQGFADLSRHGADC